MSKKKISRRVFIGSIVPLIALSNCAKDSVKKDNGSGASGEDIGKDIPNKEGMTIKGKVHSGGKGIPNVVVSDGISVTTTDSNGVYYLKSTKVNRYVFVSIPGNYRVVSTHQELPEFYKRLTRPVDEVETKSFELFPVDNSDYIVLVATDFHLANRNDDVNQFRFGFLRDINETIESYKQKGKEVYILTLGDLTWDTFWYENNFYLDDFLSAMSKVEAPTFNLMGNHDNNPYFSNDRAAEDTYRNIIGPTYYSFNLGKVHYIALDNTVYINTGGTKGSIGDRSYKAKVVDNQLEWLRKDLSFIDKDTTIIVAMHIQLNGKPVVNESSGTLSSSLRIDNATELINAFSGFKDVHFLTGHTHVNYSWETSSAMMEHNIAAVCATWWWTGRADYAGIDVCKDGSPSGYSLWDINNNNVKWKFKSIGFNEDYQFRAYDLNKCHITTDRFAPNITDSQLSPFAGEYAIKSDKNEVLINVWDWDEQWKIEVTEKGSPLSVKRVNAKDPLHIISYETLRLNKGKPVTNAFSTSETSHMFKVTASNATNSIVIKVTDRFGRVYKEIMKRPKELAYSMV